MYRSLWFTAWLLIAAAPGVSAMTAVQALETELIEEGESPTLLFELATAYADLNDAETARLYLGYLKTTFPTFFNESDEAIRRLEARIESIERAAASRMDSAIYQWSAGVDSNASQGTSLSQLDLQLANGEKLVLAVNDDSREQQSAYVGAKAIGVWTLTPDLKMRGTIEHLRYTDSQVASITLGSLELASEHQSLAVYGFERFGSRIGLAYRGQADQLVWGGQFDSDDRKVFAGLTGDFAIESSVPVGWSAQMFQQQSHGLAGGSDTRHGLQLRAGVSVDSMVVDYSVEYGRDQGLYDPIFFPGIRDSYVWQRLNVLIPLVVSVDRRIDLVTAYNTKDHEVSINSWQGIDFRIVFSAPLQ